MLIQQAFIYQMEHIKKHCFFFVLGFEFEAQSLNIINKLKTSKILNILNKPFGIQIYVRGT